MSRSKLRLRQIILVIAYLAVVIVLVRDRAVDLRFSLWTRFIDCLGMALTPVNLAGPVWFFFD